MRRIALAALVGGSLGACAYRVVPSAVTALPSAAGVSDSTAPVIQVRTYSISPTVSVLAWEKGQPEIGLRTSVPRDGRPLPAGSRQTDHRLYLSTWTILAPGIRLATAGSEALIVGSTARESHPCDGGFCLPVLTHGILIPDALLRSMGDSLVVTLVTRADDELSVTLPGDLVAGYLRTIDSVAASLRLTAQRK